MTMASEATISNPTMKKATPVRTMPVRTAGPMWGAFCAFVLWSGAHASAAPVEPGLPAPTFAVSALAAPQLSPVLSPLDAIASRAARSMSERAGKTAPLTMTSLSVPFALRPRLAAKPRARVLQGRAPKRTLTHLVSVNGAPGAQTLPTGTMSKVIAVAALKLPPASQPLPLWMQAATVPADRPYITSVADLSPQLPHLPAQSPQRLAMAGTLRQPSHPVTSSDRLPNQIEVSVGTFVVLLTNTDLQTVAVAEPNTADVSVVNARSLLVNGKTPGTTSLVVVDGKKIRQYQVRVVPPPGTRPVDVQAAIGMPTVTVRQLRGALILEGEVSTPEDSKRAEQIAGIYADKVLNQLSVRPLSGLGMQTAQAIQDAINLPGVTVRMIGETAMLEGTVETSQQAARAEKIAVTLTPKVLNLIELPRLSVSQIQQALGVAVDAPTPTGDIIINASPQVLPEAAGANGVAADATTGVAATGAALAARLAQGVPDATQVVPGGAQPVPGAAIGGVVPGAVVPGTNIPGLNVGEGLAGQFAGFAPLSVRQIGDQIILDGILGSQDDINRVVALASRSGLTVVNRLQLAGVPGAEQMLLNTVAQAIGRPGITVRGTAKRLVLEGTVPDTNAGVAAEQIARAFSTEVDNLLQTPQPLLVDIDVTFAEVTRTNLDSLGFQFPSLQDAGNGFVLGQRSTALDLPGALPSGATAGSGTSPGRSARSFSAQTAFQVALRADQARGNARILSNPRTTTLSGRTTTFQVGGQVPVPVSVTLSATGTTTGIEFKDFGVLVDVVPIANPNGVITMRLRTEVSQPDFSIGFTPFAGSTRIPGFTRRATVSEVTVRPGGTIAVSGLIQNTLRKDKRAIPLLSKLPLIGSLFTSKRFQNDQSDLVIFVTPRVLPNPLAPGMTAPAGVVAVGNTTNRATQLGNPGITSFDGGIAGGATGAGR